MDEIIAKLVKFFVLFYRKAREDTFKEALRFLASFVDFNTFADWLIYKIEENTKLTEKHKEFIYKEFEKLWRIYRGKPSLKVESGIIPDERVLTALTEMSDFYLGKFFQGDKEIKRQVLNWMYDYYLKEGNPIGKGQEGVKEFLKKFGDYLEERTEQKARQIIDTTVNFLRNAADLTQQYENGDRYTIWSATNDRLTCAACRSMDGRIVEVHQAYSQLRQIVENPQNLPVIRPIITKPFEGKTEDCPVKFPPLHPHCRCRVIPYVRHLMKKRKLFFHPERPPRVPHNDLQLRLEEYVKNLKEEEIYNRYESLLGARWFRLLEQRRNLERHFEKHAKNLGVKDIREYEELFVEALRNPNRVYLQRYKFVKPKGKKPVEKMDWVIESGNLRVVIDDDSLLVKSVHEIKESHEEFLKRAEKNGIATVRLL